MIIEAGQQGDAPWDEPSHGQGAQSSYARGLDHPDRDRSDWITDDRDAGEYARRQGITARDTMDLFCEAIVEGLCTTDEGFKLLHEMVRLGRHLRLPNRPADLR